MSCFTDEVLTEVIKNEIDLGASFGDAEVAKRRALRQELRVHYDHLAVCDDCWDRYVPLVAGEHERRAVDGVEATKPPRIEGYLVLRLAGPPNRDPVYKAWWIPKKPVEGDERRRLVALKLIGHPVGAQAQLEALHRIRHPHVARCRALGEAEASFWACVDWIDGEPLDIFVRATEISLHDRLVLFEQLCDAVGASHGANIIHRDLKPVNIIVDDDGHLYLIDFDVSKHDAGDKLAPERVGWFTQHGDMRGTPGYMAPEQYSGGPAIRATDIWALGVNLFLTVTRGDHPLIPLNPVGDWVRDLEELVSSGRYKFPSLTFAPGDKEGVESAEATLEAIIRKCTRFRSQDRYESAEELKEAIRRCREGIPLVPTSRWERWRESYFLVVQNHPIRLHVALVAVAFLLLCLIGRALGVGWRVRDANEQIYSESGAAESAIERTRDQVLIVAIDLEGEERPATRLAVKRYAEEHGIEPPVDPDDYRTWRAVHGDLMKQLAAAGPLAVVFDMYFPTEQPGDEAFIAGARELLDRGVPLVLGTRTILKSGVPDLSPTLADPLGYKVHIGHIHTVAERKFVDGEIVSALGGERLTIAAGAPGGVLYPSLSLAAFAALVHSGARLELDLKPDLEELQPRYVPVPTFQPASRDRGPWIDDGAAIPVSTRRYLWPNPYVPLGSLIVEGRFDFLDYDDWDKRTVRYEDALTGKQEVLALISGKIVIVADRTKKDNHVVEKSSLSGEKRTAGCYLQADAVCGLLAPNYRAEAFPFLHFLPVKWTLLTCACAAFAGGLIAAALRIARVKNRHTIRIALLAFAATLCAAAFAAMACSTSWGVTHFSSGGAALTLAFVPLHWSNAAAARWHGAV